MKTLSQYYILFALLALLLSSCDQETVIQIDLNDEPQQLVVEGNITDAAAPFSVRITRTASFSEPNEFPAGSGALVIIGDDAGHTDTLLEKTPGLYQTKDSIPGVPGRTYTLQVWLEGQYVTARSTMPAVVPFEDLQVIRVPFNGSNTLALMPTFTDPVGIGNNYQFIQSNNGNRQPFIFVADDRNNDGSRFSSLLLAPGLDTQTGDTVSIEMRTIDRATYKYFVALDASNGNGPNAGVPANPDNNFGGACLGYFAAFTVQRLSLVVE